MSLSWFNNVWEVSHLRNGREIWFDKKLNTLTNDGEKVILNTFFKNVDAPTEFYIRACSGYIGVQDTLASLKGEITGAGYIPKLIERSIVGFPKLEMGDGDFRIVSKVVSFTAEESWSAIDYLFLATSDDNTGNLVCALSLSTPRVLQIGDILNVRFKVRVK